ncbi:MAG: thiamine pyrophosphate-binding protein [Candidatus Binatia bacterium]
MEQELAQRIVSGLHDAGIDVITYLPETRLSQILPLLRENGSFKLLAVSSEAEAVTIGAGAALGGKQVAVYMECTGLYVSCYSILSIAKRFGVPLLLLIAHLGSFADQRNNPVYAVSGAYVTPILDALEIQYRLVESGQNLATCIQDAARHTQALKLPVALLFSGDFSR